MYICLLDITPFICFYLIDINKNIGEMLEEQRRYYKIGGKEESDYWEREEYLTKVQHPMKDVCMLWGKHSRMSKDGVRGRYNQYIILREVFSHMFSRRSLLYYSRPNLFHLHLHQHLSHPDVMPCFVPICR